jgi:DNA-binding transcriptional MerR regulator
MRVLSQTTTTDPTLLIGLLKPEQLAEQLNVTTRTLQRWETERIGPPRVVVGRQIFYRIASVDAWLISREQRRGRAR